MELLRTFDADRYEQALESWAWIDLEGKRPLFASPFGDVFLLAEDGVWVLDTLEGSLTHRWDSPDAMQADLETPTGQDRYLLASLGRQAEARGLVPAPTEVYDFTVPPILGGPLEVDNVVTSDFVVVVNIAGQLHEQLRDVPPGTKINIALG
jgi:hypothetical protein